MSKKRRNTAEVYELQAIQEDINARSEGPQLRKTFHLKDLEQIQPKNKNQELAFQLWQRDQVDCLALTQQAGVGKTLLAMYFALESVLDESTPFEKVVVIRSAVQGRDIGFLPGSEEEKNAQYEEPYSQACDFLFPWKNSYLSLKKAGKLEFRNTSFLRSINLEKSVVVLDESQNCTFGELMTGITRVANRSKFILCGDYNQNDLYRKNNDVSGLLKFLEVYRNMRDVNCGEVRFELEDIVRSGIAKAALVSAHELGY